MIRRYLDEQITLTQLAQHYVDRIKAPRAIRFLLGMTALGLFVAACYGIGYALWGLP